MASAPASASMLAVGLRRREPKDPRGLVEYTHTPAGSLANDLHHIARTHKLVVRPDAPVARLVRMAIGKGLTHPQLAEERLRRCPRTEV